MAKDKFAKYRKGDPNYIEKAICQKCGKDWKPRGGKFPKGCPYCSSLTWTQPKRTVQRREDD